MKRTIFVILIIVISNIFLMLSAQNRRGKIQASASIAMAHITSGDIIGYKEDGIYIFKGIPYANAERFLLAESVPKWQGIRMVRSYGPICPQPKWWKRSDDYQNFVYEFSAYYEGEDCHRINIWTPGLKDGKKRPVMFYIHGGGYVNGSGHELPQYDGKNLAEKGDIVTITINHRLNILGFLDLSKYGDDYKYSANNGLMDIIYALKWVRNNIEEFGGDPENITIYGQSGGGGKITSLMTTPYAKGLFHKAIISSGSIMSIASKEDSQNVAAILFNVLGIEEGDVDSLRKIQYEILAQAGEKAIKIYKEQTGRNYGWGPTEDGDFLSENTFKEEAPEISSNIPLIVGTTLHEFVLSGHIQNSRNLSLEEVEKIIRKKYGDHTDEFVDIFVKTYPDFKPYDLLDVDISFRRKAVKQADLKSRQKAPVYMYLFTWESPVMDGNLRSCHNMDTPFTMNNAYACRHILGGGEETYILADKMSSAWISFAKTGNPNCKQLPIKWKQYDEKEGATYIFDNTIEIWYNHDRELLDFIDMIYK